jgi:hypothetical protein
MGAQQSDEENSQKGGGAASEHFEVEAEEVLLFEMGFDGFATGGAPVYIGPFGLEISQLFAFITEGNVFALLALPSFYLSNL